MHGLLQPSLSIAILRIVVSMIFMAHAITRLVDHSVPGFGEFLNSKSFPSGVYMAWGVTMFELVGGLMMTLRLAVKIFCIGEIIILVTGIFIVHAQNGWFVVGKTLGGMEYSVVLITVLIAIFIAEWQSERNIRPVL